MPSRNESIALKTSQILDYLRKNPTSDKTSVANAVGISYPTASTYIKDMSKSGLIQAFPETSKSGAIKNYEVKYSLVPERYYYAGISVGASQVKVCLLDNTYRIISQEKFAELCSFPGIFQRNDLFDVINSDETYGRFLCFRTPADLSSLQALLNYILTSLETLNDKLSQKLLTTTSESVFSSSIRGIGIAFTGDVDSREKMIKSCVNLKYLQYTYIEQVLIATTHLDYCRRHNIVISYSNNTAAAAYAEYWSLFYEHGLDGESENPLSTYQDSNLYQTIVTLYFGAGTGMSVIQGGHPFPYRNIGHMRVANLSKEKNPDDELCICGGIDCFDHRIRRDVFNLDGGENGLREYCDKVPYNLQNEFRDDNKKAQTMAQYLAYLINQIRIMIDPDLIIIGGKLYKSVDTLAPYIDAELAADSRNVITNNCRYVPSILGPVASAVGAAVLSGGEEV